MSLQVVDATESHKPVLRRLLELYSHDFSEFDCREVDETGAYGYRYLDDYWIDPLRRPFLFRVSFSWAGFALVRSEQPHDMAEFFVMRKYRRAGIGRAAAEEIFRRFPGTWTVRQLLSNPAATAFWRLAIPFPYTEEIHSNEVIQTFTAT